MRLILLIGAILGFGAVAAGALFDHAVPDSMTHAAQTALRYHQLYALLITALGLILTFCAPADRTRKWLSFAAWLFITGTVVFCGSLYTLALTAIPAFGYATPFGGITLMAGWVALGVSTLIHRPS